MTEKYTEILNSLTAPDQIFAFQEKKHASGITYREFVNTPKTLSEFYDFGLLFPEWEFIVFDNERYTYQEVIKKSAQTANALKKCWCEKR